MLVLLLLLLFTVGAVVAAAALARVLFVAAVPAPHVLLHMVDDRTSNACRYGMHIVPGFNISAPLADNHIGTVLSKQLDCLHYCHPGIPGGET